MLNTQTLRFRMTGLVVVLCFVSAALVAFSCLYPIERKMKLIVGEEEYSLVSSAANFVGRDIDAKRTVLRSMAEHLTYMKLTDSTSLQKSLEHHRTLDNEFFDVVIFTREGELIANMKSRSDIGGFAASQMPFFTETVNNRKSAISQPFRSPFSGEPVVLITQPVFDSNGHVAFVLAGGIDLRDPRFLGRLDVLKPGKTGFFFIIEKTGTVIQHPNETRILVNVFNELGGVRAVTADALKGFEGWKEGVTKDGRNALIAYKKIDGTNWLMGAAYPTAEAFAALAEARASAWIWTGIVAALAGITGFFATRHFVAPLVQMRSKVGNIADGTSDIDVLDVARTDEIGALSRAFFALSQQRKIAEAKLADLALTDPLTGIGNRRQFEKVLTFFLARTERNHQAILLAYLDIDNFKSINDTFGHGVGDEVIVEFAKRLQSAVRASDTVARLAGDEFVVAYDTMPAGSEPADFALRILDKIRHPFQIAGNTLHVTTSVGLAFHLSGKITIPELLKHADRALYTAKRSGRDTYALTSTEIDLAI
jgi:diguanylate cyclase (GGDEF)-like protein